MSTGILIVTKLQQTDQVEDEVLEFIWANFFQGGQEMPRPNETTLFEKLAKEIVVDLENDASEMLMKVSLLTTKLQSAPFFYPPKSHCRIESNYFVATIGGNDEVYLLHYSGLCWIWLPSKDCKIYTVFQKLVGRLLVGVKDGDVIIGVDEFPEKIMVGRDFLTQWFMKTLLAAITDRYNLGGELEEVELDDSEIHKLGNLPKVSFALSRFDKFVLDAPEPKPLVFGSMWG